MSAPIRFIHCADLHLGSRFVGISTEDKELGKKMRSSTFAALDEIVNKAMHEAVDFIIFSGDIFDDSNETPYTRQKFADAVARAGIPCYIVFGNHDYKRRWEDSIPMPPNAYVFGSEPEKTFYPPKSLDAQVELIGVSYHKRAVYEDLTQKLKGSPDKFSIGIVHCDVDGDERSPYSPCRSTEMVGRNIDYWALGHKHNAQIISKDPYIVYPGNTQGRNSRETGEKGAFLVTVSDRKVVRIEFFETSQIIWKDVDVQIGTNTTVQQLIDDIKSKCRPGSFIRVSITGTGRLDAFLRTNDEPTKDGDVRSKESFIAMVEAQTECKCSSVEIHTSPNIDLKKRSESGDFVAAVIDYGFNLESASREELINMICETPAINKTLRQNFEAMSSDELREIVDDAIKMIVAKMGAAR